MRLHLRGSVQHQRNRDKPITPCVWRVVDKRKETDSERRPALESLDVDAATLATYTRRAGVPSLCYLCLHRLGA